MTEFRKVAAAISVVAVMGCFSAPVQAKGLLEQIFPFLFEDEIPDSVPAQGGTMAPFQNSAPVLGQPDLQGDEYRPADAAAQGTPAAKVDYAPSSPQPSTVALDLPHRQSTQVAAWASKAISESLDFDPLRYDAHMSERGKVLTPYAQEAFRAFMAKDNLLEALKSNDLVMRAFVTDASRVLNQGAIQGRYRWLMETPVTISFMPRGVNDYTGIQPKSQRINVRTQIGRVEQGGDEGVMIETMEFLPVAAP